MPMESVMKTLSPVAAKDLTNMLRQTTNIANAARNVTSNLATLQLRAPANPAATTPADRTAAIAALYAVAAYPSPLWTAIHCLAQWLSPTDEPRARNAFVGFMESTMVLLAETGVAEHMRKFMSTEPLADAVAGTSAELFTWTVNLHMFVKRRMRVRVPIEATIRTDHHRDVITKDVWGNATWTCLHAFAALFDVATAAPDLAAADAALLRDAFATFSHSLLYLIPCRMCRVHYRVVLLLFPQTTFLAMPSGVHSASLWAYLAHNEVNTYAGKDGVAFQTVLETHRLIDTDSL
jgi:hypothetical protein